MTLGIFCAASRCGPTLALLASAVQLTPRSDPNAYANVTRCAVRRPTAFGTNRANLHFNQTSSHKPLAHIVVSEAEPAIVMICRHIGMVVLIEVSDYQHAARLYNARHFPDGGGRIFDVVEIHIGKSVIDGISIDWQNIRIAASALDSRRCPRLPIPGSWPWQLG